MGASVSRVGRVLMLVTALMVTATGGSAQDPVQAKYFSNWPAGLSPEGIGKRVAERFITSAHPNPEHIVYQEVCAWYGALTFARLSSDNALTTQLIQRFDPLMAPPGSALVSNKRHVDFSMFGSLPLEIYIETRDPKYLALGKKFADIEWENPLPDGLTSETRYWIDDMYMITILQVQAYRATGDRKYLDRAAREMVAYIDKLQQTNGLFSTRPTRRFFGDGATAGWRQG